MNDAPQRLLVIGRSGQLARALSEASPQAQRLGREAFDLAHDDPGDMLDEIKPALVINAAAYTAVDRAEDEPEAAMALNAAGPGRLAEACRRRAIALVHVSTDYVFDGAGGAPYAEDAETNPLNTYGRTKLAGEHAVLNAHPGALVVRASWIFDAAGGSFLNAIFNRLDAGQPLSVVDDQISAPTYAPDLAGALLTMAGAITQNPTQGGGVFHYLGGPHASWFEFASAAIDRSGARFAGVKITPVDSSAFPSPAARPKDTRLSADRIYERFGVHAGDWRIAISAFLAQRYSDARD
ncbi:MAG: dTDP-4-dehydrorhamnose reductase [Pseudomonadota bacterium]